jgi:putative pyruvate formate lyase activating enzyme
MNPVAHNEAADRVKTAKEMLHCCGLCPRQCGVNRIAGQKGYCGLNESARCFREMLHDAEEQQLNPSHQIYMAGCNLRCAFCTVAEWNENPRAAEELDIDKLKERIDYRKRQGARTLNLLGGEPTVSLPGIIELLSHLDPATQVVLNSNMYYNDCVDELMDGLIDIYLADLKCGNISCAEALLDASDYVEVAKENIMKASRHAEVIVRHLILPGHRECCLEPTLNWLAEELPEVKISLRDDYTPPAEATSAPTEYLGQADRRDALDRARQLGLNLVR